jgi:hypothetical protein
MVAAARAPTASRCAGASATFAPSPRRAPRPGPGNGAGAGSNSTNERTRSPCPTGQTLTVFHGYSRSVETAAQRLCPGTRVRFPSPAPPYMPRSESFSPWSLACGRSACQPNPSARCRGLACDGRCSRRGRQARKTRTARGSGKWRGRVDRWPLSPDRHSACAVVNSSGCDGATSIRQKHPASCPDSTASIRSLDHR